MTNRLALVALLLTAGVALGLYHGVSPLAITNDSVQYLDAAVNLRSGHGLSTNVAHFDEQVDYGRFPVPFTHFAPGYPLVIALVSYTGIPPETAAGAIGALGFLVCIWLMWDIGTQLDAPWQVLIPFCMLWITHTSALRFANTVGTETLFTAALLAMLAAMVRDLRSAGSRPVLLLAIGAAPAAAYWVRYAGVFIVPVALLYALWRAWQTRAARPWAAGAAALTAAGAAALALRNTLYTGSWQGGFALARSRPIREMIAGTLRASYHVVFGDRVAARLDGWTVLAAVSLVPIVYWALRGWKSLPRSQARCFASAAIWTGLLIGAYIAGIMLAALRSIASDYPRYYFPLYALVLVAAPSFSLVRDPRQYIASGLLAVAIAVSQGRSLLVRVPQPGAQLRAALAAEVSPGVSAAQWLRDHTRVNDPMVAVDGQMLHYFVQRPVVSIIEPVYSNRRTDSASFHALMHAYGARYLVVRPGAAPGEAPEQEAIPFLRDLAAGRAPSWLTLAVRGANIAVFDCPACAASSRDR